jgi:hypothetical protein
MEFENDFVGLPEQKKRLVFGIGSGLISGLGPRWRELLPVMLGTFDNDFLFSALDVPFTIVDIIKKCTPGDRIYIDSGGFTLYKKEKKLGPEDPTFKKECERARKKFLKVLSQIRCKECFELDNEYFRYDEDLMSPKNYCREEVKEITGFYPTPVFKLFQGFDYWKRLCDSDMFPKLAVGGLAQTRAWNTHTEEIKDMMSYARQKGKKVHLLGCQNVEAFKMVQPSTVDYSIFQLAINIGMARQEHPELDTWQELAPHGVCWAIARAMARGFLYDCYDISDTE